MAGVCYGGSRKLRELLQEQQEPFLLHHHHGAATEAKAQRQLCCSVAGRRPAWGRAVRRALRRWDDLAGCFPRAARQSFSRRMPCAGGTHCAGVEEEFDGDGGRRLSPVSVLDVLRCYSGEESCSSAAPSHWEEDDDLPSSMSGSSPPPNDLLTGAATDRFYPADDRTATRASEEATTKTTRRSGEEEQRIISSWERIACDIARVPALAELDLSSSSSESAPEWRRLVAGEAACVGASIEAMIFEEVRAEAVRDLLTLPP